MGRDRDDGVPIRSSTRGRGSPWPTVVGAVGLLLAVGGGLAALTGSGIKMYVASNITPYEEADLTVYGHYPERLSVPDAASSALLLIGWVGLLVGTVTCGGGWAYFGNRPGVGWCRLGTVVSLAMVAFAACAFCLTAGVAARRG